MKKSVKKEVKKIIEELNLGCSIEELKDKVDWDYISEYQKLSEGFIREFKDKVHWGWISAFQKLSETFIREFKDYVVWYNISMYQKLSENFIREFQDEVYWDYISEYQKLSEIFIREFKDKVHWGWISEYQKLSEAFIREFKEKVNWDWISISQKLSENFIREFKDKVHWNRISKFQKLSENFIREFNLEIPPDNWLYKSTGEKREKIKKCGLYEFIDDNNILAYKGIRSDRHSNYNFQYQYLPGETYECHCDCTYNEDSFGLSAWTEEKARKHCGELVIKVKVNISDIGQIVHDGGKLRCTKITVLD